MSVADLHVGMVFTLERDCSRLRIIRVDRMPDKTWLYVDVETRTGRITREFVPAADLVQAVRQGFVTPANAA